jgi:hypothetical protein
MAMKPSGYQFWINVVAEASLVPEYDAAGHSPNRLKPESVFGILGQTRPKESKSSGAVKFVFTLDRGHIMARIRITSAVNMSLTT